MLLSASCSLYLSFVCFVTEGQLSSTEKPPVVVLVEAQTWQQSFANAIDASILATRGRLMVATVNFRLGVLGEYVQHSCSRWSQQSQRSLDQKMAINIQVPIAMQIYLILFRLGLHSRGHILNYSNYH